MIAQNRNVPLYPKYRIPVRLWWSLIWSAVWGKRRSILADSQAALSHGSPQVLYLGLENIQPATAYVVTCNHYSRLGFRAWWIALGINAAFAGRRSPGACEDIHWVMTSAWTFPDHAFRRRWLTPLTRHIFARIAGIYGFISMPPMPPAPHELQARAAGVLKTLRLAARERQNGVLIGLAPEGRDIDGRFGAFPQGAGDFMALLVQTGLEILPVGVSEDRGCLIISFGEGFLPQIPGDKSERDRLVSAQVKAAILRQIPAWDD